jgi:1,4-alpha-glucan branching enzyme
MKKIIYIPILLFICTFINAQELANFVNRTPIVSPEVVENEVTFRIRAPKARDVKIYGSWMKNYTDTQQLKENNEGVWEVTFPTPEPEIYTYHFIVDGVNVSDANNILMQRDGTRYLSMLLVDGEKTANYKEANQRGNLTKVWHPGNHQLRSRQPIYL